MIHYQTLKNKRYIIYIYSLHALFLQPPIICILLCVLYIHQN